MEYLLIIAAPTLIGLYVLWKTVRLHRHPPQVEVLRRTMYVCPFCQRTFMEQLSAQGCSCRTDPMSGDEPEVQRYRALSPGLQADIERLNRRGEEMVRQVQAVVRERGMDGDARRVIVAEGPISQEQLAMLREGIQMVIPAVEMEREPLPTVDNRRLELS